MSSSSAAAPAEAAAQPRKLPVLLFDVMDTLVRDPFYHHIPAFFQFSTTPAPAPSPLGPILVYLILDEYVKLCMGVRRNDC